MNVVDPLPGETGERSKVRVIGEPLGLEPPHLAGRGRIAYDSLAADDPAHRRITPQPVGVVDILVSGKPTEYRTPPGPRGKAGRFSRRHLGGDAPGRRKLGIEEDAAAETGNSQQPGGAGNAAQHLT